MNRDDQLKQKGQQHQQQGQAKEFKGEMSKQQGKAEQGFGNLEQKAADKLNEAKKNIQNKMDRNK
ncbi:MAG: hypothetical protein ACM3YO_05800 [Bacteroidota bacterium]